MFYKPDSDSNYKRVHKKQNKQYKKMANTYKSRLKPYVAGLLALLIFSPAVAIAQFPGGDGSQNDPFQIEDAQQLSDVRNDISLGVYYKLIQDITFDGSDVWEPIGSASQPFLANFDGGGFTISGLQINDTTGGNESGLFGIIGNGGKVTNLVLSDVNINLPNAVSVGALAGGATDNATITHITVSSGTIVGFENVGGIIGRIRGGSTTFADNTSAATVIGSERVGGVAGIMRVTRIERCSSTGVVQLDAGGAGDIGGLVGFMNDVTRVRESYSSAQVIMSNSNGGLLRGAGGLVGAIVDGTTEVINTYATGTLTVDDRSMNDLSIGGLVGRMEGGKIVNSYASNIFDFDAHLLRSRTGGLIGSFSATLPISAVQSSYWNEDVSGLASRTPDAGTNRTTDQMKIRSKFVNNGWNFDTVWQNSRATSMPYLRNVSQTIIAGPEIGAISDQEAWRHLGTSLTGVTYDNLLHPIWTQGVPGSDNPGSANPNIFTYNSTTNEWVALQDMADEIPIGSGFAVYVYSADFDGQPINDQGFPKSLLVEGAKISDDIIRPINTLRNGWTFLSNSFLFPVLWEDIFAANDVRLDPVVYVYDPRVTEPSYRVWNGETGAGDLALNGFISPFQGFFVKTARSGSGNQVTLPASAQRPDRNSNLLTRNPSDFLATLNLNAKLVGQERERNLMVVFSETETSNGLALAPMDGVSYVEFAVLDEEIGTLNRMFNASSPEGTYNFPIVLRNLEFENNGWFEYSGEFNLSWSGLDDFPADWEFTLTDTQTGEVTDLRTNEIITVNTTVMQVSDSPAVEWNLSPTPVTASVTDSRFILTVVAGAPVSIGEGLESPTQITLEQNYPNPFNPTTSIRYTLNASSDVRLDVFNLMGQRVASLQDGFQQAGTHTVSFDGSQLSSGVYVYRLQAGGQTLTRKMTLVK
ncbi:Por secretion system C-terminal sorting domain-containing protein [Cyclonatronum proteinivorum]|uniref:Por secretion system C-terminal sorting domain-containing protein n=1 Tax=Cyclonatronum proteinivorum TaxID=1457365 RepID=A0A345UIV7_9BACT|nr:T9SS type A sorting domain-containing protein [Cyclonatronum proteinivorum]AXJ00409.1 Por secretion system C-terminal sorting domain-containing protein [Cyclonatronum proteinivorum]